MQILFCLKEQSEPSVFSRAEHRADPFLETDKKKLNSHRWAFNAFCPQLRPNVCVLLDVGTRPGGTSIYALWSVTPRWFVVVV